MKINFFDWQPAYAAADLIEGSTELHVFSPIISPMTADTVVDEKTAAIDIKSIPLNGGDECGGSVEISSAIIAQYIGRSNISPPQIVKGELVFISPHVDGVYYWKESGVTDYYRKTEKMMIRVPNKLTVLDELGPDNAYSIILDSTKEYMLFYLSSKTPGKLIYYFMIDQANGNVTITDSINNSFVLDSKTLSLTMKNTIGTKVSIQRNDIYLSALGSINIKAGKLVNIESPNVQITGEMALALTGTDVAINGGNTVVTTTPVAGVNGFFQATTGIVSNVISGGVVSMGGSAAPLQPCIVDTVGETSWPSGEGVPATPSAPTDTATAFKVMTTILIDLMSVIGNIQTAVLAANAAHAGPATASSAEAIDAIGANTQTIKDIVSNIPKSAIPLIQGNSGTIPEP